MSETNVGPWPLVWFPGGREEMREALRSWPPFPGATYPAPWAGDPTSPFHADIPRRPVDRPIVCVWLPGGGVWVPDARANGKGSVSAPEWELTPRAPDVGESMQHWLARVTATPSINAVGSYHGHLVGGQLTPTSDGYLYERGGRTLRGMTARSAAVSAHHEACETCRLGRGKDCAEGTRIRDAKYPETTT